MDYSKLARLFGRPTARHVSRYGRPAPILPHGGMPAYESERGTLAVMEAMLVFGGSPTHPPMLLPRSYMSVVVRTQGDGLAALHDDPDAIWSWRPIIYSTTSTGTQALGSQHELEYRKGLWDVQVRGTEMADLTDRIVAEQVRGMRRPYGRLGKNARKRLYREYAARLEEEMARELPFVVANARAGVVLRENLAPQQRLDLVGRGGFFVRGEVNRLYFVELGNGFSIVDPVTHEQRVSLCLHPEEWLPYADVALATKLSIDAGRESEAELLEAANPRVLPRRSPTRAEERVARRLEERFRLYP